MTPEELKAARGRLDSWTKKVISGDLKDKASIEELAKGYRMLGAPEDAAFVASQLRKLHPKHPVGYSMGAELMYASGDYAGILNMARQVQQSGDTEVLNDPVLVAHIKLSRDRVGPSGNVDGVEEIVGQEVDTDVEPGGFAGAADAAQKSVLANMPIPISPVIANGADGSPSTTKTALLTALTAAGSVMLFFGLGGKKLEEKFPNIKRNMGIIAGVGGLSTAVAMSATAPATVSVVRSGTQVVRSGGQRIGSWWRNLRKVEKPINRDVLRKPEFRRQLRDYADGNPSQVRQLPDGRVEFRAAKDVARKKGMKDWGMARRWDPKTGKKQTWFETRDHAGQIRQVRPDLKKTPKYRYAEFDEFGNYIRPNK
ncbi:MAG: hypothetical protein COB53_10700 [Elusimicrobia bacterium]|nr:MAG: hypothetical protein COB53_10700 [Elusimicrobiota bacterium]